MTKPKNLYLIPTLIKEVKLASGELIDLTNNDSGCVGFIAVFYNKRKANRAKNGLDIKGDLVEMQEHKVKK
jgi:hypothetical protein